MPEKPEHGFTAVDQQADPNAWVGVLDKLSAEPFYAAYKQRVLDLLEPRAGRRYLDVGAGTGDDARVIASSANCRIVAADMSFTMAKVCRIRSQIPAVVCEAGHLPFRDETFDGARADRTFQHLPNPEQALAEIARVSNAGARIVVVDPDYSTQLIELADQELAQRVLRYRADQMLRNGTIAHRMPKMFRDAGLKSVDAERLTLTVRDPNSVDNVMGLRTWARTAVENGCIATEDADRWERLFDDTGAAGTFLYAVTFFITAGIKQ
jgi:ubiquinone/menaquinone biosynthesis C-methylase UbiE